MREYAVATWGSWSEEQARARIVKNALAGNARIVTLDRRDIGTEVVERTGQHIWLLQLFLLPAWQRQGLGSKLLRELLEEGRQTRRPVKLRVLRVNPAQRLYERIGFRIVDATAEHVYMEYA
jgi:GNAT superfamily N-acetyltransferase